jgi:copper chaperone CopZ
MVQYIHHVPGRLRVKFSWLRRNEVQAIAIQAQLEALEGVNRVDINLTTGSIVVLYRQEGTALQAIIMLLCYCSAYQQQVVALPVVAASFPSLPKKSKYTADYVGEAFISNVLEMMIETMVKRSAKALVGALL